jgi:hypothetical protein
LLDANLRKKAFYFGLNGEGFIGVPAGGYIGTAEDLDRIENGANVFIGIASIHLWDAFIEARTLGQVLFHADATHGTNNHGFYLLGFGISDRNGSYYPMGFAISSEENDLIWRRFLRNFLF